MLRQCWSAAALLLVLTSAAAAQAPRTVPSQLPAATSPAADPGPPNQITRTTLPDLLSLSVAETKVLRHDGATVLRDLGCDFDGNPYFSTTVRLDADQADMVTRWDLTDNRLVRYSLSNSTELADFHATRAYGIGPAGEVYLPVVVLRKKETLPEYYLARFKRDGTFDRNIRIEEDLAILQIGVFPSGNFLIIGYRPNRKRVDPVPPRRYFTGIFRSDGQLLREITGNADPLVQAGIKNGDPLYTNPTMTTPNDRTIEMGSAHVGSDGFVYAMRRMTPAVINVYSESGELVRALKVEPPAKDFRPAWFQVAPGLVAVYFRPEGNGAGVFVAVDSQTGEKRAVFDGTGQSQAFACFSNPYRFTVISTTSQGQLAAKILEPAR